MHEQGAITYADVHAWLHGTVERIAGVEQHLTLSWGFLARDMQRAGFPASHAAWDALNRDLPDRLASLDLLEILERFPTLDASADGLPDEYLTRAASFLGYAVHAAFEVHKALQPRAGAAPFSAPSCLDTPWCQVMARMQRRYVGMTLADYCHHNVRRIDPARPPTARNLQSDVGMTGHVTERVSQASVAAVEYAVHLCVQGLDLLYQQKCRLRDDTLDEQLTRSGIRHALASVTTGMLEMARAIEALDVQRAPPEVWNLQGAMWCPTRPGEKGFDGTGAPSFNLLDAFFGRRQYASELGHMTGEQLSERMPPFHRAVLAAIQREDFPAVVRAASARWPQDGDFGWARCLQEHQALLRGHLRKVFAFLEVGRLVAGRDTTNGQLHERLAHDSGHGRDVYSALERAIGERVGPAELTATVTASSVELSPDVFHVALTVPTDEPPVYAFPGDHVEVRIAPGDTFRPYSLSTISADGRSLSLTVARQGAGAQCVIGEVGVPHALTVRIAASALRPPADPTAPIVLIAGGVGISPFLGFIEARAALPAARRGRTIVFVAARTPAQCPHLSTLREHARAGVIELHVGYTREARRVAIDELLRAEADTLQTILDDVQGHVFVCGRAGFCRKVQTAIEAIQPRVPMNARLVMECFSAPAPEEETLPVLAWSTVRRHHLRDSAWIVIDGIVYDVTSYLNQHPGSASALLVHAGRDASHAFRFAHGLQPSVQALLRDMRIGRVVAEPAGPDAALRDAALRTLNSVQLLAHLTAHEALVRDDDLSLRPWRARLVTSAWLGHIRGGVLPLLDASLTPDVARAALAHAEATFERVLCLSRAQRREEAQKLLAAYTAPIADWLRQLAAPSGSLDAGALLDHLTAAAT